MYKYLKEGSYYTDLYDLGVEECIRIQEHWKKVKEGLKEEDKGISLALHLGLYYLKGERYRSRKAVIRGWMEADRKRDERLENAQEPKGIRCSVCGGNMEVTFKDLYDLEGALRVLFFFECPGCKKRKGIFDNGEEYASKGGRLSKDEMAEWDRDAGERKDREKRDRELLERCRNEFCLSEVEGEEYIMDSDRLKALAESFQEAERKQSDPDYQKVMELRKLKIAELEKFLTGVLEQEKHIKLTLDKPVMDRQVVVPLTVQDDDPSRKEYDSVHKLQRLLRKVLEGTNWRLMSEGIHYRLGYLSCRLKGYEQEADLIEIVRSKEV